MRDFIGLEDVDDPTQAALINFSFYLTVFFYYTLFKLLNC